MQQTVVINDERDIILMSVYVVSCCFTDLHVVGESPLSDNSIFRDYQWVPKCSLNSSSSSDSVPITDSTR